MERRIVHDHPWNPYGIGKANFPYYNLIETADSKGYIVEVALAGYRKDQLEVVLNEKELRISGKASEQPYGVKYIHKGVSERNFTAKIPLPLLTSVTKASLKDGMLLVFLEKSKTKKVSESRLMKMTFLTRRFS